MARLAVTAVFGVLLTIGAGRAHAAEEGAEELVALAEEAGVDVVDLLGAVNTTGLEPRTYLIAVGELAPPPPPIGPWDRLAMCESGGNWATNTGNGFYGGLQFNLMTWRAYGGVGYPHQTSRAGQIAVAERLRAARGYQPWPVCSRVVGLR